MDVRASGRGGVGAGVDGQLLSPVFKDPQKCPFKLISILILLLLNLVKNIYIHTFGLLKSKVIDVNQE